MKIVKLYISTLFFQECIFLIFGNRRPLFGNYTVHIISLSWLLYVIYCIQCISTLNAIGLNVFLGPRLNNESSEKSIQLSMFLFTLKSNTMSSPRLIQRSNNSQNTMRQPSKFLRRQGSNPGPQNTKRALYH